MGETHNEIRKPNDEDTHDGHHEDHRVLKHTKRVEGLSLDEEIQFLTGS